MINLNTNLHSLIMKEIERNESSVFLIKKSYDIKFESTAHYKKDSTLFYTNYNLNNFTEPYAPLCSIIKSFSNTKEKLSNLLNEINVYPAHKELFNTYLFNDISSRTEEVLPFDFSYEKSRMYKSFLDILNYYSNTKPLVIILENLNAAPISTIQWIKWLFTNSSTNNFKIILTLDDYSYVDANLQNQFDDLIQLLEMNNLIIELYKNNNIFKHNIIKENYPIDLIKCGDNYYNFFALEEALNCYKKHYNLFNINDDIPKLKDLCEILIKLGDTYCLMENYDESVKYYDLLLNYSLENGDEYFNLIAIQKLSLINILKTKYVIAENLAKQSYTLASKLNIEELIFTSYTLIFWINEKAKYRATLNKFTFDETFIYLAKKYRKLNMLAYFLTHTFNAIEYAGPEDKKVTFYNQGHKLATELDNQNCILSAHLKTALVYAVKGYYNVSIKYYKKVELLLSEMKDYFRLAQTYNGMGYYYLTSENYITANKYYDLSLSNLKSSWNFDEICMTIFNKGFNYLLSSNYKKAHECFNICLSVLNVLKVDRLRLTTLTRLYGIIGLNNFYLGNYYKAYSFLSNMKNNTPNTKTNISKDDDDEFFLNYLLNGLLEKSGGNLQQAKICFEKANFYLDSIEGSLKCLLPKFYYEYSRLLYELNDIENANKAKELGLEFCTQNNYKYYVAVLEGQNPPPIIFDNDNSYIDWVIEAAKQQASLNELNSKVDEINFLNTFQENLSSLDDLEKVISSSMLLLENRFALDYGFMLLHEDDNLDFAYSSSNDDDVKENLLKAMPILKNYKTAFVYPHSFTNIGIDLSFFIERLEFVINSEVHSLIYIPILKDNELKASFLCVTKVANEMFNNEITLNQENLRIINLSIKQLFETIGRIKNQEKILQSAYTDMLTGLYNRQGFYRKLSSLIEFKPKNYTTLTLFYIDLDNFKYYNDNFGHKIGDEVLIWFGELLKSVVPKHNNPIRYGGDEFLLLLINCSHDEILKISNTIYSKLEKYCGFTERISTMLSKEISIPKEKLLSCSIGILTVDLKSCNNITDLVDKADKTMYEAKKRGKHQFIFANEI